MDLITEINQMINCYKSRNFRFDFSTQNLYLDEYLNGIYIHYEPMDKKKFETYIQENKAFFDTHLPLGQERFLSEYMEYIENYCSSKRKTRYAISLTILYPKSISKNDEKKKFIFELIKAISGFKDGLPYFLENIDKGNGSYARVVIIERLYLGKKEWKIYKTSKYIDTRTGKFAKKDCPDVFKKLICKAGDFVLDKDGKKIPSKAVFSNNLRIFCYAKDPITKENMWDSFLYRLKVKFTNVLLLVCGKVNQVKKGKRLHKTNCRPEYHRFVRRRISSINYAKQVVEYTTNYLLKEACKKDIIMQPYNEGKSEKIKHSKEYNAIMRIFMKYKKRFNKKSFHDDNTGLECRIDYYDMRVDELDQNIERLLTMFFNEVQAINL